jgi:hypothetical protein
LLIARSNQQALIEHQTTQKLLNMKWQGPPRFFYAFNIIMHALFLISYSVNSFYVNRNLGPIFWTSFIVSLVSLAHLTVNEATRFYTKGSAYLKKLKNVTELVNLALCFITLFTHVRADHDWADFKSSIYSLTIVLTYLIFVFRLDKLPCIGVYVKVFRKVLRESLKLLPIAFIVMTGFFIPFIIRYSLTEEVDSVQIFNGNLTHSVFYLIEMIIVDEMKEFGSGTRVTKLNWTNCVIICVFLFTVVVVIQNMFIGIAVDEFRKIVENAKLELIKAKIEYTMSFSRLKNDENGFDFKSDEFMHNNDKLMLNLTENERKAIKSEIEFVKMNLISSISSEISGLKSTLELMKQDNHMTKIAFGNNVSAQLQLESKLDEMFKKINT